MRKENSSEFSDEMRQMRQQARELSRQQGEIVNKLEAEKTSDRRSLSDSPERQALLDQLKRQKELMTNVVDRAGTVSQQAETSEPVLSRQLYDTLRQFAQDNVQVTKDTEDQLMERGLMTQRLYDQFRKSSEPDGAKMVEVTSELLRSGFVPQAGETSQRTKAGLDSLQRGIERAAESVLGDEAEALRQAQQWTSGSPWRTLTLRP